MKAARQTHRAPGAFADWDGANEFGVVRIDIQVIGIWASPGTSRPAHMKLHPKRLSQALLGQI